jgi:hypothetical protein
VSRPALVLALIAGLGFAQGREAMAIVEEEASEGSLEQEAAGLELSPLSFNVGSGPDGRSPQRLRLGAGGTIRFGRHRWAQMYWTPAEAGLYLAGNDFSDIIAARLQTEAGTVLPVDTGALEVGLAAGPGILAINYGSGCDGDCHIGGTGLLLSPVVRYLFSATGWYTVGVVIRADLPAILWSSNCFDRCNGRALLVLGGLDLGFGWPGIGR